MGLFVRVLVVVGVIAAGAGVARAQEVTVTPLLLNFGVVRVGSPSSLMFSISNGPGEANLSYSVAEAITDVGVACSPTCGGTLTGGQSATVTVTFQPTVLGLRTGNVVVTTNDLDEGMVNVAVSGSGAESNLSSSTSPSFGNVPVAQVGGSVQNASITNNGGISLNTTAMTIVGDVAFSFAFPSGACQSGTTCNAPGRVVTAAANGGTATIPIRCDPTSAGLKTAMLNIQSDDPSPAGGTDIALSCTGTVSAMTVTPGTLSFANQRINTTSGTMSITISNVGGAAALNYSVTEPIGDQFIVTAGSVCNPTCNNLTVPAGMMATITVAFRPTMTGLRTGVVVIDDLDNFASDASVNVSGTGVEPVATLMTPTTLAFGNVRINTTSNQAAITVQNTGTMDLTINSVTETEGQAPENNFDIAGPGPLGMSTIAMGASQTWNVTCDPEVRGNKTGTVTISNNSTNAPSLAVALTCTSQEGVVQVTATPVPIAASTIDFGPVRLNTSVMTTVTLTNPGNVDVTVSSITLGAMTEGFSTTPLNNMTLLANGASPRTFSVVFAPTLDAQGTTTMTINSDWNDPVINLVGDGEPLGVSCTLDQPMLGNVQWDGTGIQGVTLRNTGTAAFNVLSVAWLSGDIGEFAAIAAGTGQGQLSGSQSRSFNLTAVPTDAMLGVRTAILRVITDLPETMGQFCDLTVSYTSVGPAVTLSPGMTVDFGGVDVDAGATTLALQLTNTGTGRMDIGTVTQPGGSFTRSDFADTSLDPLQSETLMISFDPSVEGSETMRETRTFTINTDGLFMGSSQQPPQIQITVTGFGIDRHIAVEDVDFPDTYRHPTEAQVTTRPIHVCNTGAARLDISMVEDADDVFELASSAAFMVQGASCVDIPVAFRPTEVAAYEATITLTNNDNAQPLATVTLSGNGIARDVVVRAEAFDLGRLPLGDHDLSELEVRLNNRTGDTFQVRELRPVNSAPGFELRIGTGVPLAPGDVAIDGTLHLPSAGRYTEEFEVFLDDDPVPYGRLTVTVEGVEKENYYTCASGRPVELGGGLLAALVAIALRRRRATDGRARRATARA